VVATQFAPGAGPAWEARVAALGKAVTEAELLRGLGGARDTLGGKTVVFSPMYGLTTLLGPRTVGAYQSHSRQELARWLRESTGRVTAAHSAYLKAAAAEVTDKNPVVLAFDTRDLFDPAGLKALFAASPALKRAKADPAAVAELFAGLKGITLVVAMGDAVTAHFRLDFTAAPSAIRGIEKAVALDLLAASGVREQEMEKWEPAVSGDTVTLSGPATDETIRALLSPFLRPAVSALEPRSPSNQPDAKAEASARYFQAVSKLYRALRTTRYSDFANLAFKYNAAARQIDDLPILNVDDELLQWGASVTATIRTIAVNAQLTGGQIDQLEANRYMVWVSAPTYFYRTGYYGWPGYWGGYGYGYNYAIPTGITTDYTISNYAEINNLTRMSNMQEQQFRVKTWENVEKATGELRRKMVKKYNVEF
jgi:hypothetical protein